MRNTHIQPIDSYMVNLKDYLDPHYMSPLVASGDFRKGDGYVVVKNPDGRISSIIPTIEIPWILDGKTPYSSTPQLPGRNCIVIREPDGSLSVYESVPDTCGANPIRIGGNDGIITTTRRTNVTRVDVRAQAQYVGKDYIGEGATVVRGKNKINNGTTANNGLAVSGIGNRIVENTIMRIGRFTYTSKQISVGKNGILVEGSQVTRGIIGKNNRYLEGGSTSIEIRNGRNSPIVIGGTLVNGPVFVITSVPNPLDVLQRLDQAVPAAQWPQVGRQLLSTYAVQQYDTNILASRISGTAVTFTFGFISSYIYCLLVGLDFMTTLTLPYLAVLLGISFFLGYFVGPCIYLSSSRNNG